LGRDAASYGHFCMLARALERVGDRWALLVIRDLANGPQRFTDLIDRLGGITPKTLTRRLRDLEADGLVLADRAPGRREVWYRLSAAGDALRPALDQLLAWGLRYALRPPEPGEPTHPEHLLWALRVELDRSARGTAPMQWLVRVTDDGTYLIASDGEDWHLTSSDDDATADVVVTTTRAGLARFLTTPTVRDRDGPELELTGTRAAVRAFLRVIAAFPFGPDGGGSTRDAPETRTMVG
jgi:DNA-binding HxlR family transcriptional regulator